LSTNKTPNLNLHSWVETDPVLMSEFNENFAALDSKVDGTLKACIGTYVGDDTAEKTLYFPGKPKLVIVRSNSNSALYYSVIATSLDSIADGYEVELFDCMKEPK